MTDRELLELAAKAAGKDIDLSRYDEDWGFAILHMAKWKWWNPLADDGDALRLAVKLDIDVRPSMSGKTKFRYAWINGKSYSDVNVDSYAATRRAIVRAAAEIGKAMK